MINAEQVSRQKAEDSMSEAKREASSKDSSKWLSVTDKELMIPSRQLQ